MANRPEVPMALFWEKRAGDEGRGGDRHLWHGAVLSACCCLIFSHALKNNGFSFRHSFKNLFKHLLS